MPDVVKDRHLRQVRPDIFEFGQTNFKAQMDEAEDIVNRALDARWYRRVAQDNGLDYQTTPFEPAKMLNADSQLWRVYTYKSLELIYLFLMKNTPNGDAFDRQRKIFAELYKEELSEILTAGIDYDFGGDDSIGAGENLVPSVRRLVRV